MIRRALLQLAVAGIVSCPLLLAGAYLVFLRTRPWDVSVYVMLLTSLLASGMFVSLWWSARGAGH